VIWLSWRAKLEQAFCTHRLKIKGNISGMSPWILCNRCVICLKEQFGKISLSVGCAFSYTPVDFSPL